MPTKERSSSAFLVDVDGKKILLDCGVGTIRRLTEFDVKLTDIDLLFASHFHPDHFADVEPFVHMRFIIGLRDKSSIRTITLIGPEETSSNFALLRKVFWREPNESYPLKIVEGPTEKSFGDVKITTFPVEHVQWFKSVGIRIEYDNKKLVYTGDVGSRQNVTQLINQAKDADLLIIESCMASAPTPNHFSLAQIEQVAKKANVKKVLVMHIRPSDVETIKDFCSKRSNYIMAKDGLKIEI